MKKLLFVLGAITTLACSSGETYPPPIADCDGSCGSPIISESGPDSGGSDSAGSDGGGDGATDGTIVDLDGTTVDDSSDDGQSIVDTGVTE